MASSQLKSLPPVYAEPDAPRTSASQPWDPLEYAVPLAEEEMSTDGAHYALFRNTSSAAYAEPKAAPSSDLGGAGMYAEPRSESSQQASPGSADYALFHARALPSSLSAYAEPRTEPVTAPDLGYAYARFLATPSAPGGLSAHKRPSLGHEAGHLGLFHLKNRSQAEAELRRVPGSGRFLLRPRAGSDEELVLSCLKGSRFGHHIISKSQPDGDAYLVNGRPAPGCSSLESVLELLKSGREDSPLNVVLGEPVVVMETIDV